MHGKPTLPFLVAIAAVLASVWIVACGSAPAPSTQGNSRGASKVGRGGGTCVRAYGNSSPWNTPIGNDVTVVPGSARQIRAIDQPLTSDPTQYTYPLYIVGSRTTRLPVYVQNIASVVATQDVLHRTSAGLDLHVPLPARAQPSDGSDHQLIVWDQATGDEWGFWQFNNSSDLITRSVSPGVGTSHSPLPVQNAYADYWTGGQVLIGSDSSHAEIARIADLPDSGHMILSRPVRWGHHLDEKVWGIAASNGYRYNTTWSGVPPRGFASRGAGIPYLAGLVRRCEIDRGQIDHALAFAYPYTSRQFVYPATKSDGQTLPGRGLPEGSRLQLDPTVNDRVIMHGWGCTGACFTIAKALQRYGMYLVDTGGHPKIVVEDDRTAHWGDMLTASTVSPIPVRFLRVIR